MALVVVGSLVGGALVLWRSAQREEAVSRVFALRGGIQRRPNVLAEFLMRHGWKRDYRPIDKIAFINVTITPADMQLISRLDDVRELMFIRTNVTDESLQYLGNLTQLESLYLAQTEVSGTGLTSLANLPALRSLVLSESFVPHESIVTDASIEPIIRMTGLHNLDLMGTGISNAAVARLSSLDQLRSINFGGTKVTLTAYKEIPVFGRREMVYGQRPITTVYLTDENATPRDVDDIKARLPNLSFEIPSLMRDQPATGDGMETQLWGSCVRIPPVNLALSAVKFRIENRHAEFSTLGSAELLACLLHSAEHRFERGWSGEVRFHVPLSRIVHDIPDVYHIAGKPSCALCESQVDELPTYPTGSSMTNASAIMARLTIRRRVAGIDAS
jgi:hypothetical protein